MLDRGLAKDPEDRWPSAGAMVAALDRAMVGSRPPTEPTRPIAAPPAAARRRQRLAVGAGRARRARGARRGRRRAALGRRRRPSRGRAADRHADRGAHARADPRAPAEPTRRADRDRDADADRDARRSRAGGTDLDRAADLQLQGYNARIAGDYEQALALSTQALEACGDTQQLAPCGYALYEVGAALNALGRPDEAIPYLEQRLDQYGPNKDVEKELKAAQKAAEEG